MKQKKSKTIYTPNQSFHCKRPFGWDEITRSLTFAVNRYNRKEKRKWRKSFFLHRLFCNPVCYKVEVKRAKVPEMEELYQTTNPYRIWIEDTRNKRMHFDLLCVKDSTTNSMFLQDGVKYDHFILICEDTSVRWLDKKNTFLHEIIQFIQPEVSL